MAAPQALVNDVSKDIDDRLAEFPTIQKSNALLNKLSTILSASYADSEIRDALHSLDEQQVKNTAETRRRLRLDVQKEVIERNGEIIKDFSQIAEVCPWVNVCKSRH